MEILLNITDLSRSGSGVGRDATGRVVFVPHTAPGDIVRVEILEEEKRYAEGRLLEIVEASLERVPPPCPVFGKCGGCEWQHLPYSRQWETKKSGVIHALERASVEAKHLPLEEFPADRIWEYRNRVQLRGFQSEIGFFERKSKRLVPIEKCWIARPELNERIAATREEGRGLAREYKAELEVFPSGDVTVRWNSGHSASGFRQVHDEQNEKLQNWVAKHARRNPILLDLYGGSGNLSWKISSEFSSVHCVDVGAPTTPPAETPGHYQFHRMPVFQWLRKNQKLLKNEGQEITVIADPPREGLGTDLASIVEILRELPVRQVLLIGCEPDAWARAVRRFARHGWDVCSVGALDFFPQTHHVEALCILDRR